MALLGPTTSRSPGTAPLLAGRYRLIERRSSPSPDPVAATDTELWRAVDEVLARPVAVKLLTAAEPGAAERFLAAAASSGGVRSAALAELYDAAHAHPTDGAEPGASSYVVTEWLPCRPLAALLEDGPLPTAQVVALTRLAADALTAAHTAGVIHGRVHLGNLFLGGDGRLRLTDAAIAAAAHGAGVPSGLAGVAVDTRDLAAVSYALLTARWPGAPSPQPGGALPSAPRRGGVVVSPRQLRAAVPRQVDRVVLAALDPGRDVRRPAPLTPEALATALEEAVADRAGRPHATRRRPVHRLRRRLPVLVSLAVVGAVGTGGYLLGLVVGELPDNGRDLDALVGAGAAQPLRPVTALEVTAVDPAGDGEEQSSTVVNVTDGDPSSPWLTDIYRTARFGGLKDGVGLQADLGRSRAIGRVDVALTRSGARVELRAGDSSGDPRDHAVVATSRTTGGDTTLRLTPVPGTRGRYWSLWITELPRDDAADGYRAGVGELRLYPR